VAEEEELAAGRFVEIPPGEMHSVRADASSEMVLVLTLWK
jgi:quercetin dioxygenase-like cupin family protein